MSSLGLRNLIRRPRSGGTDTENQGSRAQRREKADSIALVRGQACAIAGTPEPHSSYCIGKIATKFIITGLLFSFRFAFNSDKNELSFFFCKCKFVFLIF